ncbi:MAG: Zn-dependent hydrolase [Bacteroidota bacterium]
MISINVERLMKRMMDMSQIGAIDGGGVCRLALTDEDQQSRELFKVWMQEAGLEITIDEIGNMFGRTPHASSLDPIVIGSHLDTVGTGGKYDGSLGVLAALEVIDTIKDRGLTLERPIMLANFTNEEGVRFVPDMMGSFALKQPEVLQSLLDAKAMDDNSKTVGSELSRIGYKGAQKLEHFKAHAFIELHIEQGPILEHEKQQIGIVEKVQGISWTELIINGVANHAGTTPMSMRKDAGFVASSINYFVRKMALEMGDSQVATVGITEFEPNLINVVPQRVRMTVDLRNTDETKLVEAEERLLQYVNELIHSEGVSIESKRLVRFQPVDFDPQMILLGETVANELGYSNRRMYSGAGHDAQMMAALCPSTMIFIPSKDGISHNVNEYSTPEDIEAGANVLLNMVLQLAGHVN